VRERHLRAQRCRPAQRHDHPDGGVRGNLLTSRIPYLEFFGLNQEPFPATGDPNRILPALSYDSSCAALVHGITERRGLPCLVGEAGTGKTLLLRQLLGAPPPGVRPVVLLQLSVMLDGLVELIARPLGAAANAGLTGLRTALRAEADAGRNVVLLVDGAQALPPETLAALPELILPLPGSRGSAMQVLLAGRPALLAALRAAGLRDRIAVLARLEPWVPTDVAVYIHGQLAHAGAERRLFTPGAVARVARLTEGVPRGVNTIADASLAVASSAGAHTVTEEHVNAAWESCAHTAPPAPTRAAAAARRGARRRRRLPARLRGEGHRRDRGPAGARDDGGRRRPPGRGRARRADARPARGRRLPAAGGAGGAARRG